MSNGAKALDESPVETQEMSARPSLLLVWDIRLQLKRCFGPWLPLWTDDVSQKGGFFVHGIHTSPF